VLSRDEVTLLGIESRFHTYAKFERRGNVVGLKSGRERMQMTFAALQPGVMQESRGMPPLPIGEQTTIFRWMGKDRVADNLHVVALTPGTRRPSLRVSKSKAGTYSVDIAFGGAKRRRIRFDAQLQLL
jgi:hypothetical protein